MRFLAILLLVLAPLTAGANSPPPEVQSTLSQPVRQGAADVRVWGFDLYRAELWTGGAGFSFSQPFALALNYRRPFTGRFLAETTVKEVARIERTAAEAHSGLMGLESCFTDVSKGDRITGVSLGPDRARFFVNGRRTCEFSYPGFSQRFFGIWLGDRTRDPQSRARLLGSG